MSYLKPGITLRFFPLRALFTASEETSLRSPFFLFRRFAPTTRSRIENRHFAGVLRDQAKIMSAETPNSGGGVPFRKPQSSSGQTAQNREQFVPKTGTSVLERG